MSDTLVPEAPPAEAVLEGVLWFRDLLAAASGTDWTRLDDAAVADATDVVEEVTRMLPAVVGGALVREVAGRGLATEAGCRSTVSYLHQKLRLSRGEAAARVQAAGGSSPAPSSPARCCHPATRRWPPRRSRVRSRRSTAR